MIYNEFIAQHAPERLVGTRGHHDLGILLEALSRAPGVKLAVTGAADMVLHAILDTEPFDAMIRDCFGPTARLVHVPDWASPVYAAAWQATRAVFAERGISLHEDPRYSCGDGRNGDVCWVHIESRIGSLN